MRLRLVHHVHRPPLRVTLWLATALLLCACGGRQRLYGGPARPLDQVALLTNEWGFWSERVYIVRVDARPIARQPYTYELELRPGLHVIEFGYDGAYGHSLDNAVLLLNAEAGHHYEARADWQAFHSGWGSLFGGRGTWVASIFDITVQRPATPEDTTRKALTSATPSP